MGIGTGKMLSYVLGLVVKRSQQLKDTKYSYYILKERSLEEYMVLYLMQRQGSMKRKQM